MALALFLAAVAAAAWSDETAARMAAGIPATQVRWWNIVTAFGTSGYMFASSATVAIVALAWHRITADPARRARLVGIAKRAVFFFICLALSGIAAQVIKHGVGRLRPRALGVHGAFEVIGPSFLSGFDSFPSGHTTSAFAAAMALGLLWPRLRTFLLSAAVLIGLSRVATGNHYPSDVLCGAALGASVSLWCAVQCARRGQLFVTCSRDRDGERSRVQEASTHSDQCSIPDAPPKSSNTPSARR